MAKVPAPAQVREALAMTTTTDVSDLQFEVNSRTLELGQQRAINEELLTNLTETQASLEEMTARAEKAEKAAAEAEEKATNAKEIAAKEENENYLRHVKTLTKVIQHRGEELKKVQKESEDQQTKLRDLNAQLKIAVDKAAEHRIAARAS